MATHIHQVFVGVCFVTLCCLSVIRGTVPDGVVFTDLHKTVEKGDEVVLKCQFYGNPIAVYWKKGDDPTTSPNLITQVEGEPPSGSCVRDRSCEMGDDYSLKIKEAKIEDRGRYICRVSNYLGILIHNFTDIVVFAPPKEPYPVINECREMALSNPNGTCKITSHIPINITCSVTTFFPEIDLFFLRGFQEVASLGTNEVVNDDRTKNKSIVISTDYGQWTYLCVASDAPGTLELRTAEVVVNVDLDSTLLSFTTVSSKKKKDVRIVEIAAPTSFFLLIVVVVVFLVAMYRRNRKSIKPDLEKGVVGPPMIIKGKISFYELWFLIYCTDDDARLGKIRDTLFNLGISDVEEGGNAAQPYDVLCAWKTNHTQDTQAMDLKRALEKAGCDSDWVEIFDGRRHWETQLSEDTLKHILWQIGYPEKINQFLGELIPGKRIGIAGKMKDIIAEAVKVLEEWNKGSIEMNPLVLLSLALERASCSPIDREFFTVPEKLMEEIGELEVAGFTQRLTGRHCTKLAKSFKTTKDSIDAILIDNDKIPLYNTQLMILDWISKEECSNFEKRHRLNVAARRACGDDLKGHFGATHLYTAEEENQGTPSVDPNATLSEYGGISKQEIRRLALYLKDSEIKRFGEGDDPVMVVTEWVKSLLDKNPPGGCRKQIHDTLKEVGFQALIPFPMKEKTCKVELLDLAFRLLMTDIQPFAKALGISDQNLVKYKLDFSPKQLRHGTCTLLSKYAKNDRRNITNALSKAGFKDIATLLKYGYVISLADMFALGCGPVPNSSQREEIRQNLGIALDHDDTVAMLRHWKSMYHPASHNPRTALADAVFPVLGRDKALSILSGKSRKTGIHSENVIRALREGVWFRELCRVTEILGVHLHVEREDPMKQVLSALDNLPKNGSVPGDVRGKLSEAGFKGLSRELEKGDDEENDSESNRKRRTDSLQSDISSRIADVLSVKKTSSLAAVFDAWEEKLRKNPLKEERRRDLSDRLLGAGYEEFAHEIMTGFIPRPLDKK